MSKKTLTNDKIVQVLNKVLENYNLGYDVEDENRKDQLIEEFINELKQ